MKFIHLALVLSAMGFSLFSEAKIKVGDVAPSFVTKTDEGADFDLSSRKGKGWTVLFFYPKAETPGCTKQACAFRDSIQLIRDQNAEVYGISGDTVEEIAKFKKNHRLNFILLADPEAKIIESYGAKMPFLKIAKRWTFIIDPDLKVRAIEDDVDPAKDAQHVSDLLKSLKSRLSH